MRSFVLVILSALALAGLFFGYWVWQPSSLKIGKNETAKLPVPPPPKQGTLALRKGEVVWLNQYDRNGQLISRFCADQYIPQADGTIRVTQPVAQFFLANHQHLEIQGDDGNVVAKDVPRIAQNAFASTGPPAPPSRGRLNHVRIALVDEVKKTSVITMATDNVVFDNETYLIYTEGFEDSQHNKIANDEVPVHVAGQIEMEGRGLTVRWNDKDGRLELLQIDHGDYLKITDTSGFSLGGAKTISPKPKTARGNLPLAEMLASTDKKDAGQVLTHFPGPSTRHAANPNAVHVSSAPVIYQASFYDNIRINQAQADGQGDQILIDHVNRMDVDFIMKQSGSGATTRPGAETQPAVATPVIVPVSDEATPDEVSSEPDPVAPTTMPATQPAAAKEPPVFVHWSGVLKITPLKTLSPPVPLKPGDSSVLLVGTPLTIHRVEPRQQGTEDVRCASVLYQTSGEKVWLGKSDQNPQILVIKFPAASAREQTPTKMVSTGSIQYSKVDSRAVMTGPGNAEVPLEPDAKDEHPSLHATWAKQAEFDFTSADEGKQSFVRQGHFEGDVDIKHPRLVLRSQLLDLNFDAPAIGPTTMETVDAAGQPKHQAQPNLREVIATTDVFCQIDAGHSKQQMIECNRLALDTAKADGKLYAEHINATGSVHAYGDDDLRAELVDLHLKPAKKSPDGKEVKAKSDDENAAVELDTMVARDNVVARSKEGSVARGDELHVNTVNGKQTTILTGQTGATVTDSKGNIVKGPEIQFDAQDGRARVVGAGSLHAIQQPSATQPAQNVDVTWANEAIFDGAANHVDVDGSVLATSIDKRGYVDIAQGDHIRIDLRPKPATQPADSAAKVDAHTTKDATASGGMKMDPFKGKEVSAMTISKDAKVKSTLAASNGDVLQQFELTGPTIIVNEFADDGTPSRSITVPSAGRMLSRDHRPTEKQPADNGDSSGARGATAFQWSKQMTYREVLHRADMVGDVLVVHQDDAPDQPPVRMNCEHVIAWFESAAKAASRPATEKKQGEDSSSMQLKYLSAEGTQVVITRGETDQVVAGQVGYDPKRHLLIATGTERNPVTFSNGGSGGGSAEEVDWDTTTWKMKSRNAIFDYRPPTPVVQTPGKKKPTTKPAK